MIAIPNMEKPSCCGKCILQDGEMCFAIDDGGDGLSLFSLEDLRDFCIKRRDDCPLIEIVQCKDCRYNDGTDFCEFYYMSIFPTDFCSYGERRAE